MQDSTVGTLKQKHFGKFKKPLVDAPNLVSEQVESFNRLIEEGVAEVFKEFSPISDYSGKKFELDISQFAFGKPEYDEHFAKYKRLTYKVPLKIQARLHNKTTGETKDQEIFLADFPMMTAHGTFVVSGVERVIVPQLARSYGAFFLAQEVKGTRCFGAKIIPARGVWIEIESEPNGHIVVKIDRKRKFSITTLLRVMGLKTDTDIKNVFKDNAAALKIIEAQLESDAGQSLEDAYIEIYRRLRDGDLATADNAREFVDSIFSPTRYDLSRVGRFHLNERFGLPTNDKALDEQTISVQDIVRIVNRIVELNSNPKSEEDDIDHLGFRRVRFVGEMLQQQLRVGMSRMKRNIQDRMSTVDAETSLPVQLINPRPFAATMLEFFSTNQLSQFMEQNNILGELEHLRTVSALGPGGLTRERAGFEVRDVHESHYGRLCPIQTPEGQNIGLILRLSVYARTNRFGVIETPYAKVENGMVTGEIVYLNALAEEHHLIAHGATEVDDKGKITGSLIEARKEGEPRFVSAKEIEFIEVAANQAFSVATSMIPFLEHDDANRALMGSNMQKQAVPCLNPEAPYVATGIEGRAALDSGRLVVAEEAGTVTFVDARVIRVKNKDGKEREYPLISFVRTNNMSVMHHRARVSVGESVKKGALLADTSSSDNGQVAIGQNVRVAFMSWAGSNYEDAIIVSERLVKNSKFTSIHMEEFVCFVRDTKLGPEVTTHDIPNVSEQKLRNLDEEGVIRIGAEVRPGDILVGKVTPKGETQLSPEERLLRSIFGEKAKDVKDTSLRMEAGKRGRVVGVKVFSRENGDQLESGIIKRIHIEVAQLRNISVGDKLAGRHGNKGVISRVLPEEDMPFTKEGQPIDIILTPLGVPSRMNLGQIFEMHLGLAAEAMGYQAVVPAFMGASEKEIVQELTEAGLPASGKFTLYDGRTGEAFEQDIAVGNMYMLKLHHMVEDKIHMRSIGPYSITTQQPLGGKAQNGGQRVGEMEVWGFLGYGAAHSLREVLTIKSDDIVGRSMAFDAIVKGERIKQTNIPATFNVLIRHLRGLALDVQLLNERETEQEDN
jgi:DNA-directed RNA polymerase subunit beta